VVVQEKPAITASLLFHCPSKNGARVNRKQVPSYRTFSLFFSTPPSKENRKFGSCKQGLSKKHFLS